MQTATAPLPTLTHVHDHPGREIIRRFRFSPHRNDGRTGQQSTKLGEGRPNTSDTRLPDILDAGRVSVRWVSAV